MINPCLNFNMLIVRFIYTLKKNFNIKTNILSKGNFKVTI